MKIVFERRKEGFEKSADPGTAILFYDKWDDWGKYCTQFFLSVFLEDGTRKDIGQLKIGQRGLLPGTVATAGELPQRSPLVPSRFERLEDGFFSLGQDVDYYENLKQLGEELRDQILVALRDVAANRALFDEYKDDDVMKESLLRSVTTSSVLGQFSRLARGLPSLTSFSFAYRLPHINRDISQRRELDFKVRPGTPIPTNIHVLIGRNGVGKTRLLSGMRDALRMIGGPDHESGEFVLNEVEGSGGFANLVSVTFSALDEKIERPLEPGVDHRMPYSEIGLRGYNDGQDGRQTAVNKTPEQIAEEFLGSLRLCQKGTRRRRWENAVNSLNSDPIFASEQLFALVDRDLGKNSERQLVTQLFRKLSSGHKLALLMLTQLVEKVEEKSLVLIDEPEAHLHPPLLASITKALSELLESTNGVAILATHSPVILQEVPKSCVWIVDRFGDDTKFDRPAIETFAENVGVLTREVFQLELSNSGYHKRLREVSESSETYEEALTKFGNALGAEGRALLRVMFKQKEA